MPLHPCIDACRHAELDATIARLTGERLVFADLMDAAAKVLHVIDGEDADEEARLRSLQERLELASLQARGITRPNV